MLNTFNANPNYHFTYKAINQAKVKEFISK